MNIEDKKIILDYDVDYEFIGLIRQIIKVGNGEIRILIRGAKPQRVIELQKSILLGKNSKD